MNILGVRYKPVKLETIGNYMVDIHELHKEAQPVCSPKLELKQPRRQTVRTSQICTINIEKDALHISSNRRPEMTRFEDECEHLSIYFCFLTAHITSRLFCFWAIELRSATDKSLQSTFIN